MSEFSRSLADVYLQEMLPHPALDVDVSIGHAIEANASSSHAQKNGMKNEKDDP